MPWSSPFDDPISLPNGRQLLTLKDAADYIQRLPKAEQKVEQWQTAIHCLIGAAEGRDFLMHARIGVLRALNRHVVREFNPDRKETHWGKRKLKETNDRFSMSIMIMKRSIHNVGILRKNTSSSVGLLTYKDIKSPVNRNPQIKLEKVAITALFS